MTLAKAKNKDISRTTELELSDHDFERISSMVRNEFGLNLQYSKKAFVFSRLARRVRELQLPDFGSYLSHVNSTDGEAEKSNMLSALTTNVTHFFRESHHFEQLRTEVLPDLARLARSGERVRLWSAACSAGQEAYSLAATLLHVCPEATQLNVKILATDIDPVIINKAREGRYPLEELSAIPQNLRDIATRQIQGSPQEFEMSPEIRKLITFNIVNLVGDWPMKGSFDVILCRNVAIYFDKETQAQLWQRFKLLLKPGGYLLIGHSERLDETQSEDFKSVGITTYRKNFKCLNSESDQIAREYSK